MKKIQPLGENILVKTVKIEDATESGIILPSTASKEDPQEGEVIAVGDSNKINEKIKKGSKIIFAKYSNTEVEEGCLILKAEDVLAIIE